MPALPFKPNQDHRHHIPRQKHRVTNWPAYEAGLRQRGSLTVWFTEEAIEAWAAEPGVGSGYVQKVVTPVLRIRKSIYANVLDLLP